MHSKPVGCLPDELLKLSCVPVNHNSVVDGNTFINFNMIYQNSMNFITKNELLIPKDHIGGMNPILFLHSTYTS